MNLHRAATILIVDDDLGFVIWVGVTLAMSGYATVPAASVSEAKQLIQQLKVPIDLAIVNLALADMFALIEALRRSDRSMQVIAIENLPGGTHAPKVNAVYSRSEADWPAAVLRVLRLRDTPSPS